MSTKIYGKRLSQEKKKDWFASYDNTGQNWFYL